MSDYNSGLPIRTEADGTDERVHVKIVDGTDPSGTDKRVEVSEKLVHVREFGQDPAGVKRQKRLSENGETAIDGTYDATINTNPANVGVVVQDRNATAADSRQIMKPTAKRGTVDTTAVSLDISLHDEDGNAYTQNNPLPVSFEESEGTEVQAPNTTSSLAKDASIDHTYTVTTGKTLMVHQLWASASGKIKVEVKVETGVGTGLYQSRRTGFTSTANTNIEMNFGRVMKVAAGIRVIITITNRDNAPMDVYSTLEGVEK